MSMKVFIQGDWVYIPYGKRNFLCVGSRVEIEKSTPYELSRMIYEAMATSAYHAIKCTGACTIH